MCTCVSAICACACVGKISVHVRELCMCGVCTSGVYMHAHVCGVCVYFLWYVYAYDVCMVCTVYVYVYSECGVCILICVYVCSVHM